MNTLDMVIKSINYVHKHADARATGCWRYENGRLILEHFQACSEMSPDVAIGFPKATADVPVTDTGLGIVLAARSKAVTEYRSIDLPPDAGSGYWLRGFEADRSVAVPMLNNQGELIRILSVAVVGLEKPTEFYSGIIQAAYQLYFS